MKPSTLCIIIVSYNTRELLRNCLESVYTYAEEEMPKIYVVDNASTDGSAQMVKEAFPEVELIANPSNVGFAKANNQALRLVETAFVMLLNPDSALLPGSLQRLFQAYQNIPGPKGILTTTLLNPDLSFQAAESRFYSFGNSLLNNRLFQLRKYRSFRKKVRAIDWAHGAVMFFHRSLLEEVGLFDERFFVYGEEFDLYMRAKKAGLTSYIVPDAEVIHHGSASARQTKSKMFIQNYRSFYQLLRKHYSKLDYYAYWMRASLNMLIWWLFYCLKKDKANQHLFADLIAWQWTGKENNRAT